MVVPSPSFRELNLENVILVDHIPFPNKACTVLVAPIPLGMFASILTKTESVNVNSKQWGLKNGDTMTLRVLGASFEVKQVSNVDVDTCNVLYLVSLNAGEIEEAWLLKYGIKCSDCESLILDEAVCPSCYREVNHV